MESQVKFRKKNYNLRSIKQSNRISNGRVQKWEKDIFNYIFEYKPFVNIIDTDVFEGISCGVNYFTSTTDRRQFNLMRIQCLIHLILIAVASRFHYIF